MGIEFYQTMMGKQFFDGTMPRLADAVEKLTDSLEEAKRDVRLQPAKTCGKCGSDIPQPGPCPVCDDKPYGDYPTRDTEPPANLHTAWWSCMQNLIKIKAIIEGFENDESPLALHDRSAAIWEIVKDYREEKGAYG